MIIVVVLVIVKTTPLVDANANAGVFDDNINYETGGKRDFSLWED